MKRKSPALLVSSACVGVDKTSWLARLSKKDREYVYAVVEEMRKTDAGVYSVALLLVRELGIKRHHEVVARTLRELIRAKS